MKKLFYILLVISSLKADYLMTVYEYQTTGSGFNEETTETTFSRCIKDYYTSDSNIYYLKSANDTWYIRAFENIKEYNIKSGFVLNGNGACVRYTTSLSNSTLDDTIPLTSKNLSNLGLSDKDLNLMFAFSGVLLSFLFLFGLFRWI